MSKRDIACAFMGAMILVTLTIATRAVEVMIGEDYFSGQGYLLFLVLAGYVVACIIVGRRESKTYQNVCTLHPIEEKDGKDMVCVGYNTYISVEEFKQAFEKGHVGYTFEIVDKEPECKLPETE